VEIECPDAQAGVEGRFWTGLGTEATGEVVAGLAIAPSIEM
jgi:hypothetical protein